MPLKANEPRYRVRVLYRWCLEESEPDAAVRREPHRFETAAKMLQFADRQLPPLRHCVMYVERVEHTEAFGVRSCDVAYLQPGGQYRKPWVVQERTVQFRHMIPDHVHQALRKAQR